jgi:hypothetical protein
MLFRHRTYRTVPEKADEFAAFFEQRLLPVHLRHGARLVGRWQDDDRTTVVALWAYRDRDHLSRARAAVAADPEMVAALADLRDQHGEVHTGYADVVLTSTVDLHETELAHLADGEEQPVG